jgi:hypothetical protein
LEHDVGTSGVAWGGGGVFCGRQGGKYHYEYFNLKKVFLFSTNVKLRSQKKINSISDCVFEFSVYLSGSHFDYLSRASKNLAKLLVGTFLKL